jgi:hypothetical protein
VHLEVTVRVLHQLLQLGADQQYLAGEVLQGKEAVVGDAI